MKSFDLLAAAREEETQVLGALRKCQAGFIDPNGKGSETEEIVERQLLQPQIPPDFKCGKGIVINNAEAVGRSHAVDRLIYDARAGSPLVSGKTHSVFPLDIVVSAIEITMSLDTTKLKNDMARLAPFREMRERHYYRSVPKSATEIHSVPMDMVAPRSFIIGLPADSTWQADQIAETFSRYQQELGTLIHALYVIGIGFFFTDLSPRSEGTPPNILYWPGVDRLFRFSCNFRLSLDRWTRLPSDLTVNMDRYMPGEPEVFRPLD